MRLTFKKPKIGLENRALTAMVMSAGFLRHYKHIHRGGLMKTPYGDWLAEQCIGYYDSYKAAPKMDIKDIFGEACQRQTIPPNIVDALKSFLREGIDYDEEIRINHEYLANKMRKHLVLQQHRQLAAKLEDALDQSDPDLCERAVIEMKGINLQSAQVCDPFNDKEKIIDAFVQEEVQLVRLKGALGRILNPQMMANRMVAFLGRAKSGKTWWLYYIAQMAMRQGNNVAVFAAGDEPEAASILRFGAMLTGRNNMEEYCGERALPVFDCELNRNGECINRKRRGSGRVKEYEKMEYDRMTGEELLDENPNYVPCCYCRNARKAELRKVYRPAVWYERKTVERLSWQHCWRVFQRIIGLSPRSRLRLFTYSANSLTVSEIIKQLDQAEDRDGWVPTIVVIDYPDIMAVERQLKEVRHQENEKWLNLRKLSQDRSILLVVATQSNIGGYQQDSLAATNVNEDRRKLDHVTGMFAINQTEEEKRKGVQRIGVIVQRKGEYDVEMQVLVCQGLKIGLPVRDSMYVYRKAQAFSPQGQRR